MPDACVVFGLTTVQIGRKVSDTFLWNRRPAENINKKKVDWLCSTEASTLEDNQILGFVFEAFPRWRLHSEVFRSNWAQSSTKIAKSWSLRLSNCPYSGRTVCRREQVSCVSVCSETYLASYQSRTFWSRVPRSRFVSFF